MHLPQVINSSSTRDTCQAAAVLSGKESHAFLARYANNAALSCTHNISLEFCRVIYGRAGLELAQEVASRQIPWPHPPSPYGVIAGWLHQWLQAH